MGNERHVPVFEEGLGPSPATPRLRLPVATAALRARLALPPAGLGHAARPPAVRPRRHRAVRRPGLVGARLGFARWWSVVCAHRPRLSLCFGPSVLSRPAATCSELGAGDPERAPASRSDETCFMMNDSPCRWRLDRVEEDPGEDRFWARFRTRKCRKQMGPQAAQTLLHAPSARTPLRS